jgi:hypothetical protein
VHGGSKLQADLEERSELARTEGIQTAARNWIKEHLRTDKLRLFRDGGPLKLWVCESEFWQRVDPDDVFMQTSILDREGDEKDAYVLDRAALVELLEVGPEAHNVENAGYVEGAPKRPGPLMPKTAGIARTPARRGRKKGSGTKHDDPSVRAMLDSLADGEASSVLAAASRFVTEKGLGAGINETSEHSWIDRLRHKFAAEYGTDPPPGKTWDDVRKAGGV